MKTCPLHKYIQYMHYVHAHLQCIHTCLHTCMHTLSYIHTCIITVAYIWCCLVCSLISCCCWWTTPSARPMLNMLNKECTLEFVWGITSLALVLDCINCIKRCFPVLFCHVLYVFINLCNVFLVFCPIFLYKICCHVSVENHDFF